MNKRGITPIIAIVLLLMMTVAIAGAANFWLGSVQSSTQSEIGKSIEKQAETAQVMFEIPYIRCDAVNDTVTVNILNTGTSTISDGPTGVTLKDKDGMDLGFAQESTSIPSTGIPKDSFQEITWNMTGIVNITSGVEYGVKVTVPGGSVEKACIGQ